MRSRTGSAGWPTPDETGRRASHAFVGDDGDVWLFDPLDAPGIDEEIDTLGDVAGVAVCSRYHARDSAAFARRYDAPVYVPTWMERVSDRLEVPIEYYDDELGSSGFTVQRIDPMPGWCEAAAYRASDDTLYVPEVLGTAPLYTVGAERLGVFLLCRLTPPFEAFTGFDPARLLVGHGTGLFDEPARALVTSTSPPVRSSPRWKTHDGAFRGRFSRAVRHNFTRWLEHSATDLSSQLHGENGRRRRLATAPLRPE